MILAQDFISRIPKYTENITVGAYFEWAPVLSYVMPKHVIDLVCIRRTPMSVLGTTGGPSWGAQALVSPRMSLNKFPSPYAILKNIIVSMTLQLDTSWSTLALTWGAQSRLELVQKL